MSRPEGFIFWGMTLTWCLLRAVLTRDRKTPALFWFVVPFLLIFGCYLAWRLHYYGSWLPNSALVKFSSATVTQRINRGLLDLYFIQKHFTPLLWLLPLFVFLRRGKNQRVSYLMFVSGAFAFSFLFGLGGDWMPLYRLFVPILPVLMVLVVEGVETLATRVERTDVVGGRRIVFGLLIAPLILANIPLAYLSRHVDRSAWWLAEPGVQIRGSRTVSYYKAMGLHLKSVAAAGDVLAVDEAGGLPYYSGLRTLDYWGLTEPNVAAILRQVDRPIESRFAEVAAYVLASKPTYVQIAGPVGEVLRADHDFQSAYAPLPGWQNVPVYKRQGPSHP